MDDYFAKDFVFNPYIAYVGKVSGRDDWYKVLTSHPSGIERLTPEDLVIDENRQAFVAQIKTDLIDRDTQQLLLDQALSGPVSPHRGGRQDEDREARFLLGDPAGGSPRDRRRLRERLEEAGGARREARPNEYDEIVQWMKDYFATYNLYAQDAATVHRMDEYFAPDLRFMPYMSVFGGPEAGHRTSEDFYRMLTSHPDDYEKFEVLDIFVDEQRMVAVAFLIARIFSTKTDELLVQKHYLPLYELIVDDERQTEDQDHPLLLGGLPARGRCKVLRRREGKLRRDEFQVREAPVPGPHRPGHHPQPHPQDRAPACSCGTRTTRT